MERLNGLSNGFLSLDWNFNVMFPFYPPSSMFQLEPVCGSVWKHIAGSLEQKTKIDETPNVNQNPNQNSV